MKENVDRAAQEEFIWAMRTRAQMPFDEEADNSFRERKTFTTDYENMAFKNLTKKMQTNIEAHTKILASLVPDEIVYNCNSYKHRDYDVCLLFGDVSGFTELCEMYNLSGMGGPSRLTQVLNGYIGTMVQEIMSFNGDVLKFSGDAFLAMWKSGYNNQSMQDCVHQALDSALVIQKTHGSYETDVGVFLRVKLAIAAGHIVFSIIGTPKMSHYVVIGSPVWEVKAAEKCASAGEIVVTPSAWDYINPDEYQFVSGNEGHIKVYGLSRNWRSTQRSLTKEDYIDDDNDLNVEDNGSFVSVSDSKTNENKIFEVRPSVGDAVRLNLKNDLRKFILPPIMCGIDMEEPIEYLTEMRHIVIMFINIITAPLDIHTYVKSVDKCYKIVCRIVDGMEGCVNKVSLFDKDLMFVIIFGFRGFKHELESQRGLLCAMECYKNLSTVPKVLSTSVAVTTGMTYCGAIGHTLRREYTVISLTVNKAARLMVAYPNKVTCDRETFLHSKLESKHFILQEYRPLKGMTNVGTIYEFIEFDSTCFEPKYAINIFPTLDRETEINAYHHILESMFTRKPKKQVANTLVIFAKARQGRTRLVEEFLYCTPSAIPMFKINLESSSQKIPYNTIYMFFSVPLGFEDSTSASERLSKLSAKMIHIPMPELFFLLNPVFRVHFKKFSAITRLTIDQINLALTKLIKQLCYACFRDLWVGVVENGEFIDDESWPLLKAVSDSSRIMTVITICTSVPTNPLVEQIINSSKNIKQMTLEPIDKWYHVGIACQILDVRGIPPELEKVLHSKSNGNPGWIESFLISLIHSTGIRIKSIPIAHIDAYGLVLPPLEMIARKRKKRLSLFHDSLSGPSKISSDDEVSSILADKWRIYEQSFKDSTTALISETEMLEASAKKLVQDVSETGSIYSYREKYVDICLIEEDANIDDVDPELSLDVFIMKIFDSLSSYEQLLMKCSSVIGDTLSRDMLLYLMHSQQQQRVTALAVKKLFDIGVLACAHGVFVDGEEDIMLHPTTTSFNSDSLECSCSGLTIHPTCSDLPTYASCGYMRFKNTSFRYITYNLLTVTQKREFHSRAVRYLEKKTRRCRMCGGGFFMKMLGVRYKNGLQIRKGRSRYTVYRVHSRTSLTVSSPENIYNEKQSISADRMMPEGDISRASLAHLSMRTQSSFRRERDQIPRTFSNADFTNCECYAILRHMYKQMLEHCEATDQLSKWMSAAMEYAVLCIESYNVPLALKMLTKAMDLLNDKYNLIIQPGESWKVEFIKGKILTLIGKGRLELGQLKQAQENFESALKYYGYMLPTSKSILASLKNIKHHVLFSCLPCAAVGVQEGYSAEFCDNVSECLSLICKVYLEKDEYENADTAATWSLKKALESEKDFATLIKAFSNKIRTCLFTRKMQLLTMLERRSLAYCKQYRAQVELNDLQSVAYLYESIFKSRLIRGELENALTMGIAIIKISDALNKQYLCFNSFPNIIFTLLLLDKPLDAVSVILDFIRGSTRDLHSDALTWYYSLCICIQLDTGFTILPYKRCEKHYYQERKDISSSHHGDSERRYYTVLWLWCLRTENYEQAEVWYEKLQYKCKLSRNTTMANLVTALYHIEGLILLTIRQMDRKNLLMLGQLLEEIDMLLSLMECSASTHFPIGPRLYHLKAFYLNTRENTKEAFAMLRKAKKLARAIGSVYDENWIKHTEMAWKRTLSPVDALFWKNHADNDLIWYYDADGKTRYFTFELPTYYLGFKQHYIKQRERAPSRDVTRSSPYYNL